MAALATIGRFFLGFFAQTGQLSVFIGQTLVAMCLLYTSDAADE